MRLIAAVLTVWLCAAVPGLAQDMAVVGVIRVNAAANNEPFATLFRKGLAARGYVEGRNLRLDIRFADGDAQRFPEIAEALVKEKVSVIVVFSASAADAAQRATHTIPIVAVASELVAAGLITSLAKPGGNLTGFEMLVAELGAKRLEIVKEILPAARRLGVLNDYTSTSPSKLQAMTDAALALGVALQIVNVSSPAELAASFDTLNAGGAEAVNIDGSMLFNFRDKVGALALTHKLPAICEWPEMAAAGCLASYGTSLNELYDTLAELTDKILKGASPADLPARQPTKYELVINLKTAKALGLTVPPSILDLADEVIE